MSRSDKSERKILICDPISSIVGHHISFNHLILNAIILEVKGIKFKLLLNKSILEVLRERISNFDKYFDGLNQLPSYNDNYLFSFTAKAKWLKNFFFNYVKAFKLAEKERCSGILFTDFETISFFSALLLFRLFSINRKSFKIGIVIHNSIDEIYSSTPFKSLLKYLLLKYIFYNVDIVIVLEDYIKTKALELFGPLVEKKIVVAKYPVLDTSDLYRSDTKAEKLNEESKRKVYFVGIVSRGKGIELLLETLRMIKDEYYKFLEIGIFGKVEDIRLLNEYAGVLERVKMKNEFIPQSEYYSYIEQADYLFMLQTKYRARISGILFDAFSFSKPVISTSKILEYYKDYYGDLGFLISSDASSLSSVLILIATEGDKKSYAKFVKNIEQFKKDHSVKQFYIKVGEVCRSLCE